MARKKQNKKISPEQYTTYLTGGSSVFGSYCLKTSNPKDGYLTRVKKYLKNSLEKVDY
ncbi:MAG: hypothetical protein QXT86_11405 [Archaeoglobaceae archaeon]